MFNAYIDREGVVQSHFEQIHQADSYVFIICTRGELRVNLYTSEYILKENSLITLLPYRYFEVISQREGTELYVVSFKQQALSSENILEIALECITHILESPVIDFTLDSIEIMCDYIRVLMRIKEQFMVSENSDFVNSILKQIIVIIGERYRSSEDNLLHSDRASALVIKLIRLISEHYSQERSAIFYAGQMHISPQHLSSVVKRVTNRTITDIIAMFVIINAQTKLSSTDLSISEIAAELNFDDISSFGRYFKRYTYLSPRQYRKR